MKSKFLSVRSYPIVGIRILAGIMIAAGTPNFGSAADGTSSGPPNFVLILTDDQGWSQLSQRMDPDVADSRSTYLNTTNMDGLADGGMRFTSGYAPAPLCTPTRRSILCGTSAARSGTEFVSDWVPAEHMTIPRALKQADPDYRCAHFGKWGSQMISSPEACGYDASDGETGNTTGGMEQRGKPCHIVDDPKRTDSVTARAIQFMAEQVRAEKPFYVQVSYYAVHLRVEALEATLQKYRAKGTPDRRYTPGFAAMLEELDRGVGDLLTALEDLGVAGETYVVFMSDNGGRPKIPGGDPSHLPTNHPLSGGKHTLFEGGIRVPFFVRGPGIEPGSICRVPVAGYDLLPTFYNLAGGTAALPPGLDGGSLAPLFHNGGTGAVNRPLDALVFHRTNRKMSAIRQDEFKLLLTWDRSGKIASRALYKVSSDPAEQTDLKDSETVLADELEQTLIGYLERVGAK